MDRGYEVFIKCVLCITTKIALLSTVWKALILLFLFAVHAILTWVKSDFTWLAAFGGLLTVFGVLLIFHYSLPENEPKEYKPKNPVQVSDGEYSEIIEGSPFSKAISQERAKELSEDFERRSSDHANYINEKRKHLASYLVLTIFGTLIWAYIGFLNVLFQKST